MYKKIALFLIVLVSIQSKVMAMGSQMQSAKAPMMPAAEKMPSAPMMMPDEKMPSAPLMMPDEKMPSTPLMMQGEKMPSVPMESMLVSEKMVPLPMEMAKVEKMQEFGQPSFQMQSMMDVAEKMAADAYSLELGQARQVRSSAKLDVYSLASTVFNSQAYLGDLCTRCKKLQYLAFRIGQNYLTAKPTNLIISAPPSTSNPSNSQLFTGQQQIDGTWAFKSFVNNKYIRADNGLQIINYQNYVGPFERWYIERHTSHVHIQSAQFVHQYWWLNGNKLQQLNGGTSSFIVEFWPNLRWLWNQ